MTTIVHVALPPHTPLRLPRSEQGPDSIAIEGVSAPLAGEIGEASSSIEDLLEQTMTVDCRTRCQVGGLEPTQIEDHDTRGTGSQA